MTVGTISARTGIGVGSVRSPANAEAANARTPAQTAGAVDLVFLVMFFKALMGPFHNKIPPSDQIVAKKVWKILQRNRPRVESWVTREMVPLSQERKT